MGDTRAHTGHTEADACPVCGKPWTEWPMSHKGDAVCSQSCEKQHEPDPARVNVEAVKTKKEKKRGRKRS